MKIFRKRKREDRPAAVWLNQLQARLNYHKQRFADHLSRKTQYWSKLSWIIALAGFILLFGGVCLFLCIKAFIHLK